MCLWLTLVLELKLDLAFLALGDSTVAVRADRDEDDDEKSGRPSPAPPGPPRRCPPPEKGMKEATEAEVEEEEGRQLRPDGPASSLSSLGVCRPAGGMYWVLGTSSCLTGSELVAMTGVGVGRVSIGASGLDVLTGTSVVDISENNGAGSD